MGKLYQDNYEYHPNFKANLWSRSHDDSVTFCTKWGARTGSFASGVVGSFFCIPEGPAAVVMGAGLAGAAGYIGGYVVGGFFGILGAIPTYIINRCTQGGNFLIKRWFASVCKHSIAGKMSI